MNKKSNLKQLMEVLNSLDRSLEALMEKVVPAGDAKGHRSRPVPVPVHKMNHPLGPWKKL